MKFVELSEHTVLDILDSRSVVVDLGMNEGRFAFQARDRYGCRVFGCEPTPALAARLQDQPGIVCDPVAVAGQAGEVEFFLDDADSTASSLNRSYVSGAPKPIAVRAVTLPDFFARHNLGRVDLFKMDVEGAELGILEGLNDSWLAQHVVQMSVEFHLFRDSGAREAVERIRTRAEQQGFYSVDWTTTYMDTLFVNRAVVQVTPALERQITVRKYTFAVKRRLGRTIKRLAGSAAQQ
jgi:FkbM family methyltransferase